MTNNREIHTSYGTVRNVNKRKINKVKLYKRIGVFASALALLSVMGYGIAKFNKKNTYSIPEGQIRTTISIQIEKGDTLSELADKFYNPHCEGVYSSISNYEDVIKDENHLYGMNPNIVAGRMLEIPVIIPENNAYYQRILELENQILEMEQNNKWIRYTVKYGDLFSTLASQASEDISETYELALEIANKNGMNPKDMLRAGQEIWIINPELGSLKKELNETREMLIEFLSKDQIKK